MIGENWLKVAITAMALGIGLYVIPLGMVANPALIALAEAPVAALLAFAQLAVGLTLISWGLIAARKPVKTVLLLIAGLACVFATQVWPV